jgi:hypothetical protein
MSKLRAAAIATIVLLILLAPTGDRGRRNMKDLL